MGSVDADTPPPVEPLAPGAHPGPRRPLLLLVAVAAAVVALDQATKWWALEALTDPLRVIDVVWTLRLRVIYNTGTAFSLTSDSGPFVSVIAVGVVGYLVVLSRRQRSVPVLVGFGLIVGGTIGNVLDRILRDGDGLLGGPVIDFVDLQWFPVFNVADAALVIGIGVVLLLGFRSDGAVFEDPPPDGARTDATDSGSTP